MRHNIERLILPFQQGLLALSDDPSLVLGAVPSPVLSELSEPLCIQSFKPYYDALTAQGLSCDTKPSGTFTQSFVKLSRHKGVNRLRVAQAWALTQDGGTIVVSGDKTEGVEALIKDLKKLMTLDGVLPKSHGKVFWMTRTDSAGPPLDWLAGAEPSKNKDGFATAAGVFSAEKADIGSKLLAEHLDPNAKGLVADLGAGWGYLSKQLLERASAVEQLDLFEAEATALEMAKLNVTDPRAAFHWEDVTNMTGFENSYNLVISNPPFHESRKSEPQLGQKFIEKAARILKRSGVLMMVANRQLPYERALQDQFRTVEKVADSSGYKVIVARNPRPVKQR